MKKSTYKGNELETKVLELYNLISAHKCEQNVLIDGYQLDLYIEVNSNAGFITRIGIDCKNYIKPIGNTEISKAGNKLKTLRLNGAIDIAMIVSQNGFTNKAKAVGDSLGIILRSISDLEQKLTNFSEYLSNEIKKYENSTIYNKKIYRRLKVTSEFGKDLGFVDEVIENLFEQGKKFITLLGDYGTGKTTFAENYFYEKSNQYLSNPSQSRIPIFIPLKRYRKEINIRSLITDLLIHEYGIKIPDYNMFKKLNKCGKLLIILDAFDEMAIGADESEVLSNLKEIKTLVTEKSKIVLTCRTHYFKDSNQIHKAHQGTQLYNEIALNNYNLLFIQKFSISDIEQIINIIVPDNSSEFMKVIKDTYNLSELSKHPILLHMILKTVPKALEKTKFINPADLYDTYTKFWFVRDDWRTKMSHDQREFFMKEIAYYFQNNGMVEIHFTKLPRYIKRRFPGINRFRELDIFEADIRTCTFLNRDEIGNYSFIHRSFCEYFVARCAYDYLIKEEWPDHLHKGKTQGPISWLTLEIAHFIIDTIEKKNGFDFILLSVYNNFQNGTYVYVILSIFAYSNKIHHRQLMDLTFKLERDQKLQGIQYRSDIRYISNELKTENWRKIYGKIKNILTIK